MKNGVKNGVKNAVKTGAAKGTGEEGCYFSAICNLVILATGLVSHLF